MQRGQTPMFAREIIYTPYFYIQKRNHVGSINEFSSKTPLSLIDRMTKLLMCTIEWKTKNTTLSGQFQSPIEKSLKEAKSIF
jgi:hypothetical protein